MAKRTPPPVPTIPEKAKAFFSDPYEWQDFSTGGWDEWRCCNFMRNRVMTAEERQSIADMGLTLEDIVNGRYGEAEEPKVLALFAAWNERLGYHLYGF